LVFGSLTYYRLLTTLPPPLGRGVYFGASLEAGDLRDTVQALGDPGTLFGASVFLGADTWLGPAYFGLGVTGDGDGAAYLMLGKP
jgi:NTE family protein